MARSRRTSLEWTPSISIPVDGSWCWLTPAGRAPQNLGFVRIELQPIWFHPGRNVISTFRDLRWKCTHSSRRTRAVYLRIIGVKMRRQTMAFNQRDLLHGVQDEQDWSQHRNPEAHRRWGKRWLIAQTRGVHTDAGLLYGLEACPLKSADLKSLDYTVVGTFMKIFKTKLKEVAAVAWIAYV